MNYLLFRAFLWKRRSNKRKGPGYKSIVLRRMLHPSLVFVSRLIQYQSILWVMLEKICRGNAVDSKTKLRSLGWQKCQCCYKTICSSANRMRYQFYNDFNGIIFVIVNSPIIFLYFRKSTAKIRMRWRWQWEKWWRWRWWERHQFHHEFVNFFYLITVETFRRVWIFWIFIIALHSQVQPVRCTSYQRNDTINSFGV